MKQFFEEYGGVALGILALLVLIAMITPVGNIIKTSLQGVATKFSGNMNGQLDDAMNATASAQNSALNVISGENGGSGNSTVSVAKGQIVTMTDLGLTDVDANNDSVTDTFCVLSVDGTNVKLLAMDSYKSAYFNSTSNNTYANSILDTEMTNYYNALPDNVKNAIVEQNINQSTYDYGTSSFGSPSFTQSNAYGTNYYLTRTTETNVGNRKVYALDVDEVISYLGSTSTLQDVNELFFNQRSSVSRSIWLRSANATFGRAFCIYGYSGSVSIGYVYDGEFEVRPAFVIDLSLL